MESSEVIATYIYKMGIVEGQLGFSTAIGLLNNVINFTILIIVNAISKKYTDTSIF
jgi:putative aldouronate transport system permease protein